MLEAAHGESARAVVAAHACTAALEVEVPRERATCGTRPIDAVEANIVERTTAGDSVARHGQFQWGG